ARSPPLLDVGTSRGSRAHPHRFVVEGWPSTVHGLALGRIYALIALDYTMWRGAGWAVGCAAAEADGPPSWAFVHTSRGTGRRARSAYNPSAQSGRGFVHGASRFGRPRPRSLNKCFLTGLDGTFAAER